MEGDTSLIATTETGFLRTPGKLTIPPKVRLDGTSFKKNLEE